MFLYTWQPEGNGGKSDAFMVCQVQYFQGPPEPYTALPYSDSDPNVKS